MVLPHLDRRSPVPLFRQIVDQITAMVDNHTLNNGERLPSSRMLAEKLGVNRSTIYRAYQELWAAGYLVSRPGSTSRVRRPLGAVGRTGRKYDGVLPWDKLTTATSRRLFTLQQQLHSEPPSPAGEDVINFSIFDLAPELFPGEDFRRCLNRVMRRHGDELLAYGDHAGYHPLRDYLARRLQTHGIAAGPDEILITNGSQAALEMILKLLISPGDAAVVEAPTYAMILPLLRYHGAEVLSVPMTPQGMDLGELETVLRRKKRPAFVYTMPTFHNPTGITSGPAHREALLALCEKYEVPIIEDGYEEEMKYFGKVILPLKSLDRRQIVIYVGTFSKVLFPGIRCGFLAAERNAVERLTAIRRFCDLSGANLLQAALNEFCRCGYYDTHLRIMHKTYRRKMQVTLKALREHLDERRASWSEPEGGYLIWVNLHGDGRPLEEFHRRCREEGVMVSAGQYYFAEHRDQPAFRLCISTLSEEQIQHGIRRLGRALSRW